MSRNYVTLISRCTCIFYAIKSRKEYDALQCVPKIVILNFEARRMSQSYRKPPIKAFPLMFKVGGTL